uniref:Reverse transcriptase RNase H-like domain-containing protein n=1 Tax=Corvus moneduloides TaxID=1196302 RepID=A0A8U7NYG9_CORMO
MTCFYQGNRKRTRIEDFSVLARPLYDFLTQESPNVMEFELYVNVKQGHAKGILIQEHGGTRQPVAYFSNLLDLVARGWPHCLQNCAATALMVTEAQKLTRGELV